VKLRLSNIVSIVVVLFILMMWTVSIFMRFNWWFNWKFI